MFQTEESYKGKSQMKLSSKKVLMSIVLLLIMVLSYSYFAGEKEKKENRLNYEMYNYSVQLVNQREGNKALPILMELDNKQPNNEYIILYLGIAKSLIGDFNDASSSFQRSLNLHPAFQLLPGFNIEFAKILINNNEYSKAKAFLDNTTLLKGVDMEQKKEIDELLTLVEEKNN